MQVKLFTCNSFHFYYCYWIFAKISGGVKNWLQDRKDWILKLLWNHLACQTQLILFANDSFGIYLLKGYWDPLSSTQALHTCCYKYCLLLDVRETLMLFFPLFSCPFSPGDSQFEVFRNLRISARCWNSRQYCSSMGEYLLLMKYSVKGARMERGAIERVHMSREAPYTFLLHKLGSHAWTGMLISQVMWPDALISCLQLLKTPNQSLCRWSEALDCSLKHWETLSTRGDTTVCPPTFSLNWSLSLSHSSTIDSYLTMSRLLQVKHDQ